MQSHNHQEPSTSKNRFFSSTSSQHPLTRQEELEALEKCNSEDDVEVYVTENYGGTEIFENKLSFLIKEFKKLRAKYEEDFAKRIEISTVHSAASTSQTESPPGASVHTITKDNLSSESEELGSTLFIPANGECLYTTIFLGYLLPIIDDESAFEARINQLIRNSPPDPKVTPKNIRLLLLNNLNFHFLRGDDFQYWIQLFKNNMKLSENLWGGPQEIALISEHLEIEIKEFVEDPESDELKNFHLQIHTTASRSEHGPKEIISILRTNPNELEAIDRTEEEEMQAAQAESAVSSGNLQHYRLILTKLTEKKLESLNKVDLSRTVEEDCASNPHKFQPFCSGTFQNVENFLSEDSKKFIFGNGAVSYAILGHVEEKQILTPQEKSEIKKAKNLIKKLIPEFENKKKLLKNMFMAQEKNIKFPKVMIGTNKSNQQPATVDDVQKMCVDLQKNLIEYIQFLRCKSEKLVESGQYAKSESELQYIVELSININGPEHIETLAARLDYHIAQLQLPDKLMSGKAGLENLLPILNKELTRFSENQEYVNKIKKSLAISLYLLAQYYYNINDINTALLYLERSENLRREYGASEKEKDKPRFLRGRILYDQKEYDASFEILSSCYNFRESQGRLHPDLMPVLELLSSISKSNNKASQQIIWLCQLLDIQKHHRMDNRKITVTQLKILSASKNVMRQKERLTLIDEIQARLADICVNQESIEVGLSYLALAECRTDFLPPFWSNVKKRDYFVETLRILAKAENHLKSVISDELYARDVAQLINLKDSCVSSIIFFNQMIQQPIQYVYKKNEPHPEDIEEAALLTEETPEERLSSTKQKLRILSEFSSEVRHSLIDPSDAFLTVEDFENLPTEGVINPFRLRVAQGGIDPAFRDKKSLEDMQQSLPRPNLRNSNTSH